MTFYGVLFLAMHQTLAQTTETYKIDPEHTRISFTVNHLGFSDMPGFFTGVKGTLRFDPNEASNAEVNVTIDPKSIDMGHKFLESKLQGADYFNSSRYKTIRFKSTKVERLDGYRGRLTGDLTMIGVTKPVTMQIVFNKKGWNGYAGAEAVGFSASGKISRSEFGMKTLLPDVGDEINFKIALEAHIPKLDDRPRSSGVFDNAQTEGQAQPSDPNQAIPLALPNSAGMSVGNTSSAYGAMKKK